MKQPPLYQPFRYTAGDPPPLPVRQLGDTGEPDAVQHAVCQSEDSNGVTLSGQTISALPVSIRIEIVARGVARVVLETDASDRLRVRLARFPEMKESDSIRQLVQRDNQIQLISAELQVEVTLDPFHIRFLSGNGETLLEQNATRRDLTGRFLTLPFGLSVVDGRQVAFHDSFDVEPDEHFYGGGEKFTGFDKRGQRLEMWNYDCCTTLTERAYKNVPFFISTRGYGIFVDSLSATNLDFAASTAATLSLIVPDSALEYYVIAGPSPKTILQRYASLVGRPTLLPKWAFGLWLSSGWFEDNQEHLRERARLMREYEIPCDVLHLDSYWQRFGCWSDLIWDPWAFPHPEAAIREVKALGYKVSLWIDPRIGIHSERFEEGRQRGYFLKGPDGETQVVDSWDGFHPPVANLDFTNPEAVAWFQANIRALLRMGVDAIKTDNGEKVPLDAAALNGLAAPLLHNGYSLLYNDAVTQAMAAEPGKQPVLWGRSTFSGGQRHSAQWSGDSSATYQDMAAVLRAGLSLAMCGHAFWSHDIGGFSGQPTPDLYIRWVQFGAFSPLARLHGMTSRLPWDFGEEALRICRDYIRLRYRLLPYLYHYALLAAETSLPILRPMWLEFPDDPLTYSLDLQYTFGEEFLVAPVYHPSGRRPVYLPAGRWVDYWSHEVIQGPALLKVEAPLEKLPLYLRANALIPTIPAREYIADEPFDFIQFDAYLLDEGHFILRDRDGSIPLRAELRGEELRFQIPEVTKKLAVRFVPLAGQPAIRRVLVNDRVLLDADTRTEPGAPNDSRNLKVGDLIVMLN